MDLQDSVWKLTQNFFGPLVLHFRDGDLNFDDLVAAFSFMNSRGDALLA